MFVFSNNSIDKREIKNHFMNFNFLDKNRYVEEKECFE